MLLFREILKEVKPIIIVQYINKSVDRIVSKYHFAFSKDSTNLTTRMNKKLSANCSNLMILFYVDSLRLALFTDL